MIDRLLIILKYQNNVFYVELYVIKEIINSRQASTTNRPINCSSLSPSFINDNN